MDRRTSKDTAGLTTSYIYDGDHAAVEYDNSGILVRKFIYGLGIDEPLVMLRRGDSPGVEIKYYYHADVLGSIAGLTNSTGAWQETYSYSAWGKLNGSSSVGNPYFYTGRRYDSETGLYYYRARYYDAYLRRFIQPDPIGFDGGMNWYAYVGNSPVNAIDPYGLAPADAFKVWHDFVTNPNSIQYGMAKQKSMFSPTLIYGLPFTQQFFNRLLYQDNIGIDVTAYSHDQLACEYQAEVRAQLAILGIVGGGLIGGGYSSPKPTHYLTKSEQKAINSLSKRLAEHQNKLKAYKTNPEAFDNKGLLSRNINNEAIRQQIINRRIRHLEKEIKTFQDNIDKILDNASRR